MKTSFSATLALASFMSVMDLFIVNVALHTIGSNLHHSLSDVAWVLNAYALFFGCVQAIGAAMLIPSSLGLVLTTMPRPERGFRESG